MRTLATAALCLSSLCVPLAAQAGEVTVIRPRAFIGAEATYFIALDGRPLRDIETRQHVRFDVPTGRHTLAVRCPKPLSLEYVETRIDVDLGGAPAFFVIEPKYDCVTLSPVDARAAASLMDNTQLRTSTATSFEEGRVEASAAVETRSGARPAAGAGDIGKLTAAWVDAFNGGDPARIAALYDEEAVLIATSAKQPVSGAAAIRAYFAQAAGDGAARVALGEHAARAYGDTAIDSGLCNFFFVREGKPVLVPARYTLVYRKRDGKWLIVEHHSSRVP